MSRHGKALRVIQLENRIAAIEAQIRQGNRLAPTLPLRERAAKVVQINNLKIERAAAKDEITRLLRG